MASLTGSTLTIPQLFSDTVSAGNLVRRGITITTKNTQSGVDYTAAEVLGGVILRNTNSNSSDDIPNASDLNSAVYAITGLDNSNIGSITFDFIVANTGSNQISIGNGIGSTLIGQASLDAGSALRIKMVRISAVTWSGFALTGDE
jgi:hypothetical protein